MKSRIASCVTGLLFVAATGWIAAQSTQLFAQSSGRILFPAPANQSVQAPARSAQWSKRPTPIPRAASASASKPVSQADNWRSTQEPPSHQEAVRAEAASQSEHVIPTSATDPSEQIDESEQGSNVGPALYVQDPSEPANGTIGDESVEEDVATGGNEEPTPSTVDASSEAHSSRAAEPMAPPDPNAIQWGGGTIQQTGATVLPKRTPPATIGQPSGARPIDAQAQSDSEVAAQLKRLYAENGQQMSADFSQPNRTASPAQRSFQRMNPRQPATQQAVAPLQPQQAKKPGLLRRLMPFRRDTTSETEQRIMAPQARAQRPIATPHRPASPATTQRPANLASAQRPAAERERVQQTTGERNPAERPEQAVAVAPATEAAPKKPPFVLDITPWHLAKEQRAVEQDPSPSNTSNGPRAVNLKTADSKPATSGNKNPFESRDRSSETPANPFTAAEKQGTAGRTQPPSQAAVEPQTAQGAETPKRGSETDAWAHSQSGSTAPQTDPAHPGDPREAWGATQQPAAKGPDPVTTARSEAAPKDAGKNPYTGLRLEDARPTSATEPSEPNIDFAAEVPLSSAQIRDNAEILPAAPAIERPHQTVAEAEQTLPDSLPASHPAAHTRSHVPYLQDDGPSPFDAPASEATAAPHEPQVQRESDNLPPVVDLQEQSKWRPGRPEARQAPTVESRWEEPLPQSAHAAGETAHPERSLAPTAQHTNPGHASRTRGSSNVDRIASRDGTGYKGFCPVVLRDERNLADANDQFNTTYKGKTYFFSSQAAKSRFEANPERYAPANGGNDVVMLVRHDKIMDGSLDYAGWYKDRLYLFSSAENLETFTREPRMYASE